jgi:hypothetical protein
MSALPPVPPPPSGTKPTLDFARGFRFVFDDPDWVKKMLIGGGMMLLSVLIIGSLWAMGYWVRLVRNVERGDERPLPEWDDLGGMLGDGARAVGVYLAHFLVVAIPFGLLGLFLVLLGGGAAHMAGGSRDAGEAIGALAGIGAVALYGILWIVMLVLMLYVPSALTRFALADRFGAGFEIGENLGFIRRNLLNYFLALVLYLVASFVSQFGVILCCVGVFPLSFWALCLLGFGMGETARLDR